MSRFVDYLRGSFGNRPLEDFPHHVCLTPNLHSKLIYPLEDETEGIHDLTFCKDFPFNCTIPLPLLPMKNVPKSFLYGIDPAMELVEKKSRWKHLLKQELRLFLQGKRLAEIGGLTSELNKRCDVINLPQYIVVLAKILANDPDDQFDGFYNWYYTGGCLNHISLQGNKYLLKSGGKKFDKVVAVPLCCGKNVYLKPDLASEARFSIKNKKPIYQIVADDENRLVGVRQMKKCVIFSISRQSGSLKFKNVQEINSSYSFTSIDFDKSIKGYYVTMKTNSTGRIVNINRGKSVREWKVPDCSNKFVDKWCSAVYGQNSNVIICSNRRYIRTYDPRAKQMNCIEFCPGEISNVLENCDEIMCVVEGTNKATHPLIYVATNHHLVAMDLRFPRAFVQRWAHGMKHAPCYMRTTGLNDTSGQSRTEVVLLCSQSPNELHAVVNSFSVDNNFSTPLSAVFPISLPSLKCTLSLAQWHGKLLDPLVQKRLSAVSVGMCCFEGPEGGITCMNNNSVGDVFQQHLLLENTKDDVKVEEALGIVSKWEKSKLKDPCKKLEAVIRTDHRNLFRRLATISDDVLPSYSKLPKKLEAFENWKISKRRLFRYNDLLAPKILKEWKIEDEDEWKEDSDEAENEVSQEPLLPQSQDPSDKVEQWLGKMNLFSSTPIPTQDRQRDFQDTELSQFFESQPSNIGCDSPIQNKPQVEKRKLNAQSTSRLKKKKFIDGF